MIMIVVKTKLDAIPENCLECPVRNYSNCCCDLPYKRGNMELSKLYKNKRHKDCPLMEVEQ